MTMHTSRSNRTPWILVGVLGCLALCLFLVLVAGGLYAVVSRTQPTPVARELSTIIAPATPMPLATSVARPTPIATPTTSSAGRIAYVSGEPIPMLGDPSKKRDAIYLMNADGSQRTLVADQVLVSGNLFWSPDGTRIVFDAMVDTNVSSIYLANADGSEMTRLTNCAPFVCASPAWSPDGKRIAFKFDSLKSQGPQLSFMNPDGSQQTPLASNMGGIIRQLAWSPDGKRIALQDSCRSIRVVSIEGSKSNALTECGGLAEAKYPAWSPDGRQIAFIYQRASGGGFALYVMNADGSQQTRLAADLGGGSQPVWSPDGKQIAFGHIGKNKEGAISLINPDGSGVIRLTPGDLNAGEPAWSPDGKRIAFSVVTQGQMKTDIYVMNADGSGITRLTNDPLSAHSPTWQPSSR
jgi:Tol biopolymer transport system component